MASFLAVAAIALLLPVTPACQVAHHSTKDDALLDKVDREQSHDPASVNTVTGRSSS